MNEDLEKLIKNNYWYRISIYKYLTLDFIREFQDKIDWRYYLTFFKN